MSVEAVNALTARWAATATATATVAGEGGTVLSGAGAYPLLTLLAPYATGDARAELAAVASTPPPALDSAEVRLAVAAWIRDDLPLTDDWLALPESLRGRLSGDPGVDQPVLDRWAAQNTAGLIERMPVAVTDETRMILASALSVVTTWRWPFTERPCRPAAGPWAGRELLGLDRGHYDPALLRVVQTDAGTLTLLAVPGEEDVDVVLALGPADRPAAAVLPAAVGALPALVPALPGGADVPVRPAAGGPGVTVRLIHAFDDRPQLDVSTVAFAVSGEHDLLAHAELFGLVAATDTGRGHFPGISPEPLAVSQAKQSATALFGAVGFKAAAVTAMGMVRAGSIQQPSMQKELTALTIDRPFGFLAVHRPTGAVLVAGWVTEPEPYR
ncbi:serpin family protein [Plantactinospora siamensis]|uniref:Serpin family protein n=1 Tax=Plantactinospora siamensis TaxID=555372 RepID=A0ABV6NRI1_9ACTN